MPMNTPEHIAGYIIQATADPKTHGKALYVAGGNAVDIEEGIWRLEPQWLGEKNSRDLKVGNAIMGLVSLSQHLRPSPLAANPHWHLENAFILTGRLGHGLGEHWGRHLE